MSAEQVYQQWLHSPYVDDETKAELQAIQAEPAEIADRFYQHVQFGTAGMRGLLGAGTNRINRHTIRRATQGLANHIKEIGEAAMRRGVVIAYDSRHQSAELAQETACTLAANGVQAYLFESLRPSPELSFAVRELCAMAGIVLTASHNPKEYNGFKVYGEDGGQIVSERARLISEAIDGVQDFAEVLTCEVEEAERSGRLRKIGDEIDDRYVERLLELCLNRDVLAAAEEPLKVVYTPLHGAAGQLVRRVLSESGVRELYVVAEQERPDPNFSTVAYPNPEDPKAFELAVRQAMEVGADLVLGNDPDGDRIGVLVPDASGEFVPLSGNQLGALLLNYLLSELARRGAIPKGAAMIKTIVTSELGRAIASEYGVETLDTLTGFKYIAEWIERFEQSGDRKFLFGYEESLGYLAGTFVRDKDGIMVALLACEMAAVYKRAGKTLYQALQDLYARFGHYRESLVSFTMTGMQGQQQIQQIMNGWRNEPPQRIGGTLVLEQRDYLHGVCLHLKAGGEEELTLPRENAIYYLLEQGGWFCLRPSGTEPKMKIYLAVRGDSEEEAAAQLAELERAVLEYMETMKHQTAGMT